MTRIVNLEEIKEIVKKQDISSFIEQGFEAYSKGLVIVPPVGELIFDDPPGDTHIKYGYIKNDDYFVIKIASGFYENYKLDLPTGSGLMLLFSQKTGKLECILLDEGYLTDVCVCGCPQRIYKSNLLSRPSKMLEPFLQRRKIGLC